MHFNRKLGVVLSKSFVRFGLDVVEDGAAVQCEILGAGKSRSYADQIEGGKTLVSF